MNLIEAFKAAREGNFVSHIAFNNYESMHQYNTDLYYEDGTCITANNNLEFLKQQEWAK